MSPPPEISRRTLATLELFQGLSASALDDVREHTRGRALAKDIRVFNQGDSHVRAHALIEGNVRISQSGSEGAQIVIRFIGPGEMFGTMALFTDRCYPADAETLTDAIEASWSEADLLQLINRHTQIAINALRIVGKRLQETQYRLRELSTQPVERRVAHTVLRLAHQAGKSTPDGLTIAFPLRRKDIADICGTTLYSVSRVLTAWERSGLVTSRDRRLTVTKISEIRQIAGEPNA